MHSTDNDFNDSHAVYTQLGASNTISPFDIEDPNEGFEKKHRNLNILIKDAPLPDNFGFCSKQSGLMIGAMIDASLMSVLYYVGAGESTKLKICGIGINFIGNTSFAYDSLNFTADSIKEFGKKKWIFIAATLTAIVTSLPPTIATYQFYRKTDGEFTGTGLGLCAFLGSLPSQFYGMSTALTGIKDWYQDDPEARQILLDKFKELAEEAHYGHVFQKERNALTRITGKTLGLALGTAVSIGSVPLICSSKNFYAEKFFDNDNDAASYTLAAISNGPQFAICLTKSGFYVGKSGINFIADIGNVITGQKRFQPTFNEMMLHILNLLMITTAGYLAFYSGETSRNVYKDNCPDFGPLSSPLLEDSDWSARVFNFAIAIDAINTMISSFIRRSAKGTKHLELKLANVQDHIAAAPIEEVRTTLKNIDENWERLRKNPAGARGNNSSMFTPPVTAPIEAESYEPVTPKRRA